MQSFHVRKENRTSIFVKGLVVSFDEALFVDDEVNDDLHMIIPNFSRLLILPVKRMEWR